MSELYAGLDLRSGNTYIGLIEKGTTCKTYLQHSAQLSTVDTVDIRTGNLSNEILFQSSQLQNSPDVIPAKAGIQSFQGFLDPRLRGGDSFLSFAITSI
jgi:hypothetical protein